MDCERLLRESQREVLRLQRQLSVTSCRHQHDLSLDAGGPEKCDVIEEEKGNDKVNSSHHIRKYDVPAEFL